MKDDLLKTSLGKAMKHRLERHTDDAALHLLYDLTKSIDAEIDKANNDGHIESMRRIYPVGKPTTFGFLNNTDRCMVAVQ